MADDAIIIGQVSVKVTPDTSGIPRELKVKLEAIEDRVDPIEVETEVDTSGIEREVKQAVRDAERRAGTINLQMDLDNRDSVEQAVRDLQKEINKLDEDFKISVDLDRESLTFARDDLHDALGEISVEIDYHNDFEGLHEAKRQLERLVRDHSAISLEVDPDEDSLRRALDGIEREIERSPVEIRVRQDSKESVENALRDIDRRLEEFKPEMVFNVRQDREALEHLKHQLEDLKDEYNNTELDFEPVMDGLNYRFTALRLSTLARDRWVQFRPLIDSKAASAVATQLAALSGARMLGETFSNLWDLVKNLDKNIPLIGGVTAAIMGLTSWLMSAISNTFALSRSLAQIFGAALVLPGIMAGFAVGIGATVAVLKDIKEVLPGIGETFGEIRREMSDRFWFRAAEPIWQSFQSFIDPFRKGLLDTSLALGTWFADMAEAADEHLTGSLDGMFYNLNDSIRIAAVGADDFAGILEVLGRRGSEYLPRMARWFNNLTRDFRGWLDEADRTGKLNDIIEAGLEQLHQFGRVLGAAGGILTDFAIAAEEAGGSTLTILADQLEDIERVTSSPEFHRGLVRTFEAAHDAMDRIARQSGPRVSEFFKNLVDVFENGLPDVGDAVGSLIGGIAEALSTSDFTQGFLDFLDGIREGVESLDGVWTPIGDGLGALATFAGDIAREFGPLLAEALRLAAEAAERLQPTLSGIVESLSGRLLGILEVVGPLVIDLADAFLRLVDPLIRIPGVLETVIVLFAGWKIASTVGHLTEIVAKMIAFKGALSDVAPLVGTLQGRFPRLTDALRKLVPWASGAAVALGLVAVGVAQADSAMRDAVKGVGANLDPDAFKGLSDGAWEMNDGLRAALQASLEEMDQHQLGIEHAWDTITGKAGEGAREIGTTLEDLVGAYGDMADRAEVSTAGLLGAINGVTSHDADMQRLAEMTSMFDGIMSDLVNDGNLADAAVLYDGLRVQLQEAGYSAEAAVAAFPAYTAALEENAELAAIAADEQARANAETLGLGEAARVASEDVAIYEEALRQVNGVTPKLVQSIADAAAAFVDLTEGLDMEEWNIDSYLDGLEQQVQAMETWADNMALIAGEGNEAVTAALRDLGPEGAQLVQDLADGLASGNTEAWDRFVAIVEAGTAESVLATSEGLGELDEVVSGAMLLAQLAAENGMGQLELAALLGGQGIMGGIAQGIAESNPEIAAGMDVIEAALQGDLEALALLGTPEGQALVANVAEALNLGVPDATTAGEALAYGVETGLNVGTAGFYQTGGDAQGKFLAGLGADPTPAKNGGDALARHVQEGLELSLPEWVQTGKTAVGNFLRGILGQEPLAKNQGTAFATAAKDGAKSVDPQFQQVGYLSAHSFTDEVSKGILPASKAGAGLAGGVKTGLDPLPGMATLKGSEAGYGLRDGLKSVVRDASRAARDMVDEMIIAWKGADENARIVGNNIGLGFVKGVTQYYSAAGDAGEGLGSWTASGAKGFYGSLFTSGTYAGSGFVAGVNSRRQSAYSAGYNLGLASLNGSRTALRVASPSKEMMEVGYWSGQGLIIGLDAMRGKVEAAGGEIARAAADGMSGQDLLNLGNELQHLLGGDLYTALPAMAAKIEQVMASMADSVKRGMNATAASLASASGPALNAANAFASGFVSMASKVEAASDRVAAASARSAVAARANLAALSQRAVSEARGESGQYDGATVYQTIYNPTERSSSQELNSGLQTLGVLID